MDTIRKPFQGVWNIIRFNWHFYVIAIIGACITIGIGYFIFPQFLTEISTITSLGMLSVVITLMVSWYVYDFSDLYSLDWLRDNIVIQNKTILNINAGFDETSTLLVNKLKPSTIKVFDFYNPQKHTEVSIKRARKAYPPYPNTQTVNTESLPLEDNSIDYMFNILSAHEIRSHEERVQFFKELNRVLTSEGKVVVTEHLRDIPNFLAYNIGFFHFHSTTTWKDTFEKAGFLIEQEIKITPFISTFILKKHDYSS